MRAWWLAVLVLLAACEPPVTPGSAEACRVEKLTSVAMRPLSNVWVVDVQVQGKPAVLMVDTGASSVNLVPEAVLRLGARIVDGRYAISNASGTTVYRRALQIDTLAIGTETVERLAFPELDGAPWAKMGFDGILGMDAFARYDIEIDFAGRMLSLYRKRFCPAGPPPWTTRYVSSAISGPGAGRGTPVVPVQLNGQAGYAVVDTGSTVTLVDADLARRAGGGAEPPTGARTIRTLTAGDAHGELRHTQFRELLVAGARFTNPSLWVGQMGQSPDMLVGLDIMGRGKLWISGGSDRLYISVPPTAAPPATAPASKR